MPPQANVGRPSFTTTFSVDADPDVAFAAILHVRGWWSEDLEGRTERLDDEFTYRHANIHTSTQRLIELIWGRKVVWRVLGAHLAFTADPREWEGTELVFEVARVGAKTEVRFTHVGLAPDHECFDVCSNAWRHYIEGSLQRLVTTGRGTPDPGV